MRAALVSIAAIVVGAALVIYGLSSAGPRVADQVVSAAQEPDLDAARERRQREVDRARAQTKQAAAVRQKALEERAAREQEQLAEVRAKRSQAVEQHRTMLAEAERARADAAKAAEALARAQAEALAHREQLERVQKEFDVAAAAEAARRTQLTALRRKSAVLEAQRSALARRLDRVLRPAVAVGGVGSPPPPPPESVSRAAELRAALDEVEAQHAGAQRELAAAEQQPLSGLPLPSTTVSAGQVSALSRTVRLADTQRQQLERAHRSSQGALEQATQQVAGAEQALKDADTQYRAALKNHPASAELEIDRALASAVQGVADYAKPARMTVGTEYDLWLTLKRTAAESVAGEPAADVGHAALPLLTAAARVRLDANPDDFSARALSSEQQSVASLGTTWKWRVVPLRPGSALRLTYLVTAIAEGTSIARDLDAPEISIVVEAKVVPSLPWYQALGKLIGETSTREATLLVTGAVTSFFGLMKLFLWKQLQRAWYRVRDRRRAKRKAARGAVDLHVGSEGGTAESVPAELCDLSEDQSGFGLLVAVGAVAPVVGAEVSVDRAGGHPLRGTVANVCMQGARARVGVMAIRPPAQ